MMRLPGPFITRSGLSEDLARWVAAGLLSEEQATAILAHERTVAPSVVADTSVQPIRAGRIPVVAEALGYLGGMLAATGLVLVVARYWADLEAAGRLTLSGAGAALLLAGGALVHEQADPALARLRWFLWLTSTAATALFAGILTADALDVGTTETVALASAAAVALHSALTWQGRERPLQQLTFLGGLAVSVGALVDHIASAGGVGLAVLALGGAYVLLGLAGRTSLPLVTEGCGAVAAVVGAGLTAAQWPGLGLPLLVATALALLAAATVPGVARARRDEVVLGLPGALALFQGVPSTLGYFSQELDAAGPTGLATWTVGGALVFVGARGLVRTPVAAESLGALAVVGGAAFTAGQWPGFAPIFGIATAVAMVALGMLPDRVLMSLFGSLGLLVNVPWAIGRFFPGEGRVPLLILVSGGLILVIAVLLTRRGDRARRELGGQRPVRQKTPSRSSPRRGRHAGGRTPIRPERAACAERESGPMPLVAERPCGRRWNREEPTMSARTEDQGGVVLLDVLADEAQFDRAILERLGHPVITCSGPDVKKLCPLLGGEGCPKFDQAHGVVFELDLDRAQHRAIVRRYREMARPDLPIRVVVRPEQQDRYAELLADLQVWDHAPTVADLDGFAAQVEAADHFA